MSWESSFKQVQSDLHVMFCKKNKDYGDAFARYGPIGCLIRIEDKLQRLRTITTNRVEMVIDETMEDTFMDIANYCTLAVMMMHRRDT